MSQLINSKASSCESSLSEFVKEKTGISSQKCYQCGKCSAGCPVASEMDFSPSLVMRMLQTTDPELEKRILKSLTIWLCLNCETCYVRCPMEIDIPVMMDALRQESLKRKTVHPQARRILAFHRAFLDSVKYTGRLYEVGMTVDYKARTRTLFQDLMIAPKLFFKGKLHLIPERIRGRAAMRRLFNRTLHKEKR